MTEDFMNKPIGNPVEKTKETIKFLENQIRDLKHQQGIIHSRILSARKELRKYERILAKLEEPEE